MVFEGEQLSAWIENEMIPAKNKSHQEAQHIALKKNEKTVRPESNRSARTGFCCVTLGLIGMGTDLHLERLL